MESQQYRTVDAETEAGARREPEGHEAVPRGTPDRHASSALQDERPDGRHHERPGAPRGGVLVEDSKAEAMTRRRNRGLGTAYPRADSKFWWIQYTDRNGDVRRESSGKVTEDEALEVLELRIKAGRPAKANGTLNDLPDRLVRAYRNKRDRSPAEVQRYDTRVRQHFAHLAAHFGADTAITAIDYDELEDYVDHRRKQGAKSATIRTEIAAFGRGYRLAIKRPIVVPEIGVQNTRQGFFTAEDMASLLPELPDYMRPFAEAALITGWRRGELRNLTWSQVDWERGVLRLETSKNDEGREFPFALHPRLEALLREQLTREPLCGLVFHRRGHKITWFYDGWKGACERAGIAGRLFHDLRRSAARNLIDAGIAESTAMKITGHKTASMFKRYTIRSNPDVVAAVKQLAAFHELQAARAEAKVVGLRTANRTVSPIGAAFRVESRASNLVGDAIVTTVALGGGARKRLAPSLGHGVAVAVDDFPLAVFAAIDLGDPQCIAARLAVDRDRGAL